MDRALSEFVIEGVPRTWRSTAGWCRSEFIAGHLSTGSSRSTSPRVTRPRPRRRRIALLAAALHAREERLRVTLPERRNGGAARSAWR